MSKVFRPKRGTKSKAISQLVGNNILKQGEIFFEIPDSGEGKEGSYGIKMGDGKSSYDSLPYIVTNTADTIANEAKTIANAAKTAAINASASAEAATTTANNASSAVSTLSGQVYKTNNDSKFNTAVPLLVNGSALLYQWAQIIVESGQSYFGIRNDGNYTYFMNGGANGWSNYITFGKNGDCGFPYFIRTAYAANATTSAATNCYISTDGIIAKTTNTSSKRFKEDIKPVENKDLNPNNLYDVEVVQFKYKKDHFTNEKDIRYRKDMIGLIAEDLYEHYPISVDYHLDEDGNVVCEGWNDQYLIPAMLKLIQDQNKKIIELEERINKLENK